MSQTAVTGERPSRLGDYVICSQLGAGGFGTVYLAFDRRHERAVALKLPKPAQTPTEREVERFLREARNLESLQHPGIVPVYESGRSEGIYFIAMQFIEGTTLADQQVRKRLAPERGALLVADVAEALDFAHSRGIVHRDVKPSNVLLDLQDRSRLTDFGLAITEGEPTVEWLRTAGTPEYMSPEHLAGQQPDRRSDIYSVGLVLYELLCGHRAFRADTVPELLAQIRTVEPIPPRTLKPDVPRELERICQRAIAKRPESRYPSAGELAAELRKAVRELSAGSTVQPPAVERVEHAKPSRGGRPAGASLILLKSPDGVTASRTIPLTGEPQTIGRDADRCQIVIPHHAVSREHARITSEDGKYFIEDLKSRNHTFVNSKEAAGRVALKPDDRIKICDFLFQFRDERVQKPGRLPPWMEREWAEEEEDPVGMTTIEATQGKVAAQDFLQTAPAERLRALLDISTGLSKTLDLEPLLNQIADTLLGVFKQADRCFVLQLDDAGRPIPRVVKSRRAGVDDARFSKTIVRKTVESLQSFLSEDASSDAALGPSVSIAEFRIRSVMCVPLATADGRPLGAIQLDTQDRAKKFTTDDLNMLTIVANLASISVEKANLHQFAVKQQVEKVIEQRNMALTTVHSLRQPVTVIHGALIRMEQDLKTPQPDIPRSLEALEDAFKSLNRTQEIIAGILRFIRPPQVNRLRVDLTELVDRCVALYARFNPKVAVRVAPLPGAAITGDAELMRQVVEELLNNAARGLRGGGTVHVRLGRTKREDNTPAVRVEVEDDGPGIAAEVRDKLFQPYVTTHADGKGLGLVFIKYVIEQHGGEVWFEDAHPRGARFVFRLPLAAEQTNE